MKRVLFLAEAATLAHVARPLALSAALDPQQYELTFACDPSAHWLLQSFSGARATVQSMPSSAFLERLSRGQPLYDQNTLEAYVREDLELLERVKPHVVVGDFRLSLSVSARLAAVPYVAICNAYWSPYYTGADYSIPALPLTRFLPLSLADTLFGLARPLAFALHARPLNRVRRKFGLPSLGYDLRNIYTDSDLTLYADAPELFPTEGLPGHHRYLGPVLWSPPQSRPKWWESLPQGRPIVYVTLGSSGDARLLPDIIEALSGLDVTVIIATAGVTLTRPIPANTFIADYLPGIEAAQRAALVVCNGGSPTSQQALAAGVPVLGVCSNMDQFLNMKAIARAGAGELVRADRFDADRLRATVQRMLNEPSYTQAARRIAVWFAGYPAGERISGFISGL